MAQRLSIVTGGQSGVDRAALDVALELGIPYGGWCPRGGWAEDLPAPPGLLAKYPALQETPLADPAQRTEWNVRDSDAVLILVEGGGSGVSKGTALAQARAERDGKPWLSVELGAADAAERAAAWLRGLPDGIRLAIGGPRESEAPGIHARALAFLRVLLAAAMS